MLLVGTATTYVLFAKQHGGIVRFTVWATKAQMLITYTICLQGLTRRSLIFIFLVYYLIVSLKGISYTYCCSFLTDLRSYWFISSVVIWFKLVYLKSKVSGPYSMDIFCHLFLWSIPWSSLSPVILFLYHLF